MYPMYLLINSSRGFIVSAKQGQGKVIVLPAYDYKHFRMFSGTTPQEGANV